MAYIAPPPNAQIYTLSSYKLTQYRANNQYFTTVYIIILVMSCLGITRCFCWGCSFMEKISSMFFFSVITGVMQNPYLGIQVVRRTFFVKLWIRQALVEIREKLNLDCQIVLEVIKLTEEDLAFHLQAQRRGGGTWNSSDGDDRVGTKKQDPINS